VYYLKIKESNKVSSKKRYAKKYFGFYLEPSLYGTVPFGSIFETGMSTRHVPELLSSLIALLSFRQILGHVPELLSSLIALHRAVSASDSLTIALICILPKFRWRTETELFTRHNAVFCQLLAIG